MENEMSKLCLSVVIAASMLAIATPVSAQTRGVRAGGLTCNAEPTVGFIVGSRQDLRCVFQSSKTGRRYTYSGTINRVGLDIGFTAGGRLFWAVFAPTKRIGYGALRGTYVGVSSDVSFGVGVGANILVGGSNRTISLQPLSVEAQAGANLALGVASLTLR
jgi:hypothetical protein